MPEQIPDSALFGEFNEDGSIKSKPRVTAIPRGLRVEAGDALVRIKGTKFFYYVQAVVLHKISDAEFEALEALAKPADKPVVSTQTPAPVRSARPALPVESKETNNDSSN